MCALLWILNRMAVAGYEIGTQIKHKYRQRGVHTQTQARNNPHNDTHTHPESDRN